MEAEATALDCAIVADQHGQRWDRSEFLEMAGSNLPEVWRWLAWLQSRLAEREQQLLALHDWVRSEEANRALAERQLADAQEKAAAAHEAICWAMGYTTSSAVEFRPRDEAAGDGRYWWRSLWRMAYPAAIDAAIAARG